MTNNQTTDVKPRKQVLTPPGKPVSKEEGGSVTPRGKNIEVVFDKIYGLYVIQFTEGGPVPKELSGKWTEEQRAQQAIELYLQKYWKNRV